MLCHYPVMKTVKPCGLEQRDTMVSFPSTNRECDPFFYSRRSEVTERMKGIRFMPIKPIRGFSFLTHSVYELSSREQFVKNIQSLDWDAPLSLIHSTDELIISKEIFTIDNISDFLPRPTNTVDLQIDSIRTDLPDSGDSQSLCDE